MTEPHRNRIALIALMLVLFIDGMGQGIIFPILTSTITNVHSTEILQTTSQHNRDFWYGVLIAVYYFMWFLGATVFGDWSDSVGRKRVLLWCLILAGIGFLLSALSFEINSLILLLFARFLGGLTSGDQAIAQASVIDMCDPEKKTIYLGLVLVSVTLGLVIGPLIGAYLMNPSIVSWFNIKTPFYFAALLTLINILLLQRYYVETRRTAHKKKLQWARALHLIVEAFRYRPIIRLLWAYVLGQTAWAMVYVYAASYLTLQYQTSATETGWFIALIGAGLGIGLGILPSFFKTEKHKSSVIIGYLGMLLLCVCFLASKGMTALWISVIPATALLGLAFAHVTTLFSQAVSNERQGWIMGVTGSMVALTAGIDSLISGFLANIDHKTPYAFSIVVFVLSILLLISYKHQKVS